MTQPGESAFEAMPVRAPLRMAQQPLNRAPIPEPTRASERALGWRIALFMPAITGTFLLLKGLYGLFSDTAMSGLEWFLLCMIGLTFIWVGLSVSTVGVAVAGLFFRDRRQKTNAVTADASMTVALLVPIYNENASDVFGNCSAMMADLARQRDTHRYSIFILSDTQDGEIAAREERAYALLKDTAAASLKVFYRRRRKNTDRKVGNLAEWITSWGGAYDAMVVLDADSLMRGRTISRLTDGLSSDPNAGLIQTCPMLIGADTVFGRLQQFSNTAYGWLLAEGLAKWARGEGNYWGHNAIIRTRAFAASAGLPRLKGRRGEPQLIMSHDFVEAGLLRRAGWRVRFMPSLSGSYEETPHTLIDYVLRDQRWCRGNLQHLRLLHIAGLHPVSRFHLLHGAVSYLVSPAWFVLLVIWFLLGKDSETNVISYFNEANPLFPDWPPAMSHIDSAIFLIIMYAMLLTPKVVSAAIISSHPKATRLYGGRGAFLAAFSIEILLSIAYAPILMVQQTRAVVRAMLGLDKGWCAQNRSTVSYPVRDLLRFHWLETAIGTVLAIGLLSGLVSWWLVPIALSLLMAVPLSAVSALPIKRFVPRVLSMQNPLTLREPEIVKQARKDRMRIDACLNGSGLAAE
ncbi:MAG: glucans biosynthesis glucosyltransferase MdoH [Pseudomonadota bacterium]